MRRTLEKLAEERRAKDEDLARSAVELKRRSAEDSRPGPSA